MRALLLVILLQTMGAPLTAHAHMTGQASDTFYDLGIELFQKQKYSAAQHYLERYVKEEKSGPHAVTAQYYAALCAVRLGQPDGEQRCHRFIQAHPQHPKAVLAYYQLGSLYFGKQDFVKSIDYYLQVDADQLDQATRYALQYHLAYAYLNIKNFDEALVHFDGVKAYPNAYCYAANYYAGYIALRNGNYVAALNDLEKANESAAYRPVVPYLVLQVYYQQKRFQELITYANALPKKNIDLKNKDDIALLTAEAHFLMKKYATAARHYEDYIGIKELIVNSEVLYRTAYALHQTGDDYKALKYFKELAIQQDAIGQLASYHAGLIYSHRKQKRDGLIAFDKARKMDFSKDIQAEATFQYARLSYELGHFANTIEALQNFKAKYPANSRRSAADTLLSQAYWQTNDYDLAISHITLVSDPSEDLRKAYQKATFYKGNQCFNEGAYQTAIALFQKSLKHPLDAHLALQARLWLGESFSALRHYQQAQRAYEQLLSQGQKKTKTHHQARYGLGYAYYNTAQYEKALACFLQYARLSPHKVSKRWLQDAQLRVADCYYATKKYSQALKAYSKVRQYRPAHVYYQQGVIHGILGDKSAAHASLQVVFQQHTDTPYYEKALFELGNIGLLQNDYQQTINALTRLIQKKPNSSLMPDVLLNRAIAYVNLKKYNQAIQDYERLLKQYPRHANGQDSLLELSKIYQLAGKPKAFEKYLAVYKASNADQGVLEQLAFDTAKSHFYDQDYVAAIKKLRQFLTTYPQSKQLNEALFLVAEAHYRQGAQKKALRAYRRAVKDIKTPFYNKILWRLGMIYAQLEDFEQALGYYQQLQASAKTSRETYHALEGSMKANHALQRYAAAQQSASLIMKQGNLAANATNEAMLFLGKAAMQQKKPKEARAYFKKLLKGSTDVHAAEAQYLLAQLHYEAQEFQKSLTALFELNKQFSGYKVWTNRGFLLIAENYIALEEAFQAKATLQSIIDNAADPKIVAVARQKLAGLQEAERKLKDHGADGKSVQGQEFKTID